MLNEQLSYDPIEHALKKRKSQINYSSFEHIVDSVLQVLSEGLKTDHVIFFKDLLSYQEEIKD